MQKQQRIAELYHRRVRRSVERMESVFDFAKLIERLSQVRPGCALLYVEARVLLCITAGVTQPGGNVGRRVQPILGINPVHIHKRKKRREVKKERNNITIIHYYMGQVI